MFSQSCKYAMRAMFLLAQRTSSGSYIGIKEIAEGLDAPQHFIAKILQDLSKRGFVSSAKGPKGGFIIDAEQRSTTLYDLVMAIDGNKLITSCCLGLKDCSEKNPCPVHHDFKPIRKKIQTMLASTKIGDYNDELAQSVFFLKDAKSNPNDN
jgi:Rrf2 family protein